MKTFPDRMTRGVVRSLRTHGILLLIIGIWFFFVAVDFVRNPFGAPLWRIYPAVFGWGLSIVAAVAIIVLSWRRLGKPFEGTADAGLSRHLRTLFKAEVVVAFCTALLSVEPEFTGRLLFLFLAGNFFLLGFCARAKNTASAPPIP